MYPYPGPPTYRAGGQLPDLPDHARAWALGEQIDDVAIRQLAAAFDIRGPVVTDGDGWAVTAGDREVRVRRDPGLPWSVGQAVGDAAGGVVASGSGVSAGACIGVPGAAPTCPPPPPRPADLPTRDAAETGARHVLERAGIDLTGAQVRVDDGWSQWYVSVDPSVGGAPVEGWPTTVTVGPRQQIVAATGWLARPAAIDDYPLVGIPAAIDRLNREGPWGGGGGPRPMAARAQIATSAAPVPMPGKPVVRTIVGAHLGLRFAPLASPTADRGALLVPAYVFDLQDGGTVSVIAVANRYLPPPLSVPVPEGVPPVKGAPAPAPAPGAPTPAPAEPAPEAPAPPG